MNNQLDTHRLIRRLSPLLGVDLAITVGIALSAILNTVFK